MINIDDSKKELIKNIKKSSDIYKILEDEIKDVVLNKKMKMTFIVTMLSKELNRNLSLSSLKKFVASNKQKWLKEKQNKEMKNMSIKKEHKKKFILFANDKGGVGKTTLATLLNLPDSLILNLDRTREIADIYPYKKIVDFGKVETEENIELEYFLEILNEDNSFQNIIIDTKGGITEDLIKILPYIDSVIIPIKVGSTSEKPSYEFILQLKDYLSELNDKDVKWAIVYNEISPKFLKKNDFGKYELADEYKNMEKLLKKELLGNKLKTLTYFKRSEAITTREKEKKDINELMKTNFGAYLVVKKEIERFNKEIEKTL